MWFYCWSSDYNAGPILKQHWVKALCLRGCTSNRLSPNAVSMGGIYSPIYLFAIQNTCEFIRFNEETVQSCRWTEKRQYAYVSPKTIISGPPPTRDNCKKYPINDTYKIYIKNIKMAKYQDWQDLTVNGKETLQKWVWCWSIVYDADWASGQHW